MSDHSTDTPSEGVSSILASLERYWAAEQREREYQAALPPDRRSTRPHSPYLRLQHDIAATGAGQLHITDIFPHLHAESALPAVPPLAVGGQPSPVAHAWYTLTRMYRQLHRHWKRILIVFGSVFGVAALSLEAYASIVAARPTTVTYVNAPLATVVAELRRQTGLDIRLCRIPPNTPPVTVTLALSNTPVETILDQVVAQSDLMVHWPLFPLKAVLIQPRFKIDPEEGFGWGYNIKNTLLMYTTIGCDR